MDSSQSQSRRKQRFVRANTSTLKLTNTFLARRCLPKESKVKVIKEKESNLRKHQLNDRKYL